MSDEFSSKYWPVEIRIKTKEKSLEIDFDNGDKYSISAELLRVESPSAEVQGHGTDKKTIVYGRRHVGIVGVDPVGNYAIRIRFDDLHDTGIYSWRYLHELGKSGDSIWEKYLERLEEEGFSRDP